MIYWFENSLQQSTQNQYFIVFGKAVFGLHELISLFRPEFVTLLSNMASVTPAEQFICVLVCAIYVYREFFRSRQHLPKITFEDIFAQNNL